MCETCGCATTSRARADTDPPGATKVLVNLLAANDAQAAHNRDHFDANGVLAVNLMSSPGAGKTALLETTARFLGRGLRIGVIEGDLATKNDADRIRALGLPMVQICIGTACHLDARMVHDALHALALDTLDILFIENVGNLVCPAGFDLGQHHNVVLLSTPEGDDKPSKYPVAFRKADAVPMTKRDLAPYMPEFDPARAAQNLRRLGNPAPVLELSARTGEGVPAWCDWIASALAACRTVPVLARPP